ncbi:MAG: DNA-3-methyladenine glycosylase [Acidimicrobiales bacterium]
MARRLGRPFFARAPDDVAADLVGRFLVVHYARRPTYARLVEVEAYAGRDDPASHAFRGPTPRTEVMFGPAGHLYVYRSYGVHWCVNVVTGTVGDASAVLLRAAEVVAGTARDAAVLELLRGPGLLTRGLGITGDDNGLDCCARGSRVSFADAPGEVDARVSSSPRVGITRAVDRPSRYFLAGHPAVSGPRRPAPGTRRA